MKKVIRKRVAKKKPVKVEAPVKLSFSQRLNIKMLVLSAQLNALKAQVVITVRQWAAKLRGY